jgi:hypothetical protein
MSLYGIFVLHDLIFIIVINLQLLACIIVLLLRLRLIYSLIHCERFLFHFLCEKNVCCIQIYFLIHIIVTRRESRQEYQNFCKQMQI